LLDEAHRDEIRPRREHLSELDERRPELLERHADALLGGQRLRCRILGDAGETAPHALDAADEAEPRHEVAPAVLDEHRRDLAHALQVADGLRDAEERRDLHGGQIPSPSPRLFASPATSASRAATRASSRAMRVAASSGAGAAAATSAPAAAS